MMVDTANGDACMISLLECSMQEGSRWGKRQLVDLCESVNEEVRRCVANMEYSDEQTCEGLDPAEAWQGAGCAGVFQEDGCSHICSHGRGIAGSMREVRQFEVGSREEGGRRTFWSVCSSNCTRSRVRSATRRTSRGDTESDDRVASAVGIYGIMLLGVKRAVLCCGATRRSIT